jgi:hypothetical protein
MKWHLLQLFLFQRFKTKMAINIKLLTTRYTDSWLHSRNLPDYPLNFKKQLEQIKIIKFFTNSIKPPKSRGKERIDATDLATLET